MQLTCSAWVQTLTSLDGYLGNTYKSRTEHEYPSVLAILFTGRQLIDVPLIRNRSQMYAYF
jgi:hypothetical protein